MKATVDEVIQTGRFALSSLRKQGSRNGTIDWIPAFGLVDKVPEWDVEIAARFFESLAMT